MSHKLDVSSGNVQELTGIIEIKNETYQLLQFHEWTRGQNYTPAFCRRWSRSRLGSLCNMGYKIWSEFWSSFQRNESFFYLNVLYVVRKDWLGKLCFKNYLISWYLIANEHDLSSSLFTAAELSRSTLRC